MFDSMPIIVGSLLGEIFCAPARHSPQFVRAPHKAV